MASTSQSFTRNDQHGLALQVASDFLELGLAGFLFLMLYAGIWIPGLEPVSYDEFWGITGLSLLILLLEFVGGRMCPDHKLTLPIFLWDAFTSLVLVGVVVFLATASWETVTPAGVLNQEEYQRWWNLIYTPPVVVSVLILLRLPQAAVKRWRKPSSKSSKSRKGSTASSDKKSSSESTS